LRISIPRFGHGNTGSAPLRPSSGRYYLHTHPTSAANHLPLSAAQQHRSYTHPMMFARATPYGSYIDKRRTCQATQTVGKSKSSRWTSSPSSPRECHPATPALTSHHRRDARAAINCHHLSVSWFGALTPWPSSALPLLNPRLPIPQIRERHDTYP
jgi:hypothetical protein